MSYSQYRKVDNKGLRHGIWVDQFVENYSYISEKLGGKVSKKYVYRVCYYVHGKKQGEYKTYKFDVRVTDHIVLGYYYGLNQDNDYLPFETGWFKDDKLDGVVTTYHNNGNILEIVFYKGDVRHGVSKLYDTNGRLCEFSTYDRGEITGYAIRDFTRFNSNVLGLNFNIEEIFYL